MCDVSASVESVVEDHKRVFVGVVLFVLNKSMNLLHFIGQLNNGIIFISTLSSME